MECFNCHSKIIEEAAYCPRCGKRQPEAPSYDMVDYAAFISYRHVPHDQAIAKKLHRAIESYRLPKGASPAGDSRKLGKVFRDQDELPAVGSLPGTIQEALKRSQSLIVICSPSTKESAWVNQEIELFASYHGRERIFTALAEGASAECIPPLLREHLVVDDGSIGKTPSEPLAADFRRESKGRFSREKLRIIAALAGCGLDDLVQRDRARRRRHRALAAFSAVTLVVAIGVLAFRIEDVQKNYAENEALRLAASSISAYRDGRGLDAKKDALAAIDAAERAGSRDLVPEAQNALEVAAGAYPSLSSPWIPNDSRTLPESTDSLAVNPSGVFYATVDSHLNAVVRSTLTDAPVATFPLPLGDEKDADRIPENWKLNFCGSYLIASNPAPSGSGIASCFNLATKQESWRTTCYVDTLRFPYSDSSQALSGSGLFATYDPALNCLHFGGVQVQSGNCGYLPYSTALEDGMESRPDIIGACESLYRGAFAAGSTISVVDTRNSDALTIRAPHAHVSSMRWHGGKLFVASYDSTATEAGETVSYTVSAYTPGLEDVWSLSGEYTLDSTASILNQRAQTAAPLIAISGPDSSNLLMSAGTSICHISTADGAVTPVSEAANPVVSLSDALAFGDQHIACAASANGDVLALGTADDGNASAYSDYVLELPESCKDAFIGCNDYFGLQVIARSASDNHRLFSYRSYLGDRPNGDEGAGDSAFEGNNAFFFPSYDGAYVLGASQARDNRSYDIIDGVSLDVIGTVDMAGITEADSDNAASIESFPCASDPSIIYFYADKGETETTLFAYSLEEQRVTGQAAVTDKATEGSAAPTFPELCHYATPYGALMLKTAINESNVSAVSFVKADPATLEILGEIPCESNITPFAAWAVDGRVLVAHLPWTDPYSIDGTLALIDERSGSIVDSDLDAYQPYTAQPGDLTCIAVDRAASRIVVACNDDTLRCFDLPSGSLLWETPFSGNASRTLIIGQDGSQLFSQDENGFCSFFDMASGERLGASENEMPRAEYGMFSQDGQFIASYRAQGASIYSTCVLSCREGRIGIASDLEGVPFISPSKAGLIVYETPSSASRHFYYTIDELYSRVTSTVNFEFDFEAYSAQGGEPLRESPSSSQDSQSADGRMAITEDPIGQ